MKLPIFKRLNANDFADTFKPLVDTLALSLNTGIELIYTALNQRVSLGDNILCDVKTVSISVDSNGIPTTPTSLTVSNPNITSVLGIEVIFAQNTTNSTGYPTSGIFVSYTQTQTQSQTPTQLQVQNQAQSPFTIQIDHITGLRPNDTYNLRFVIYG